MEKLRKISRRFLSYFEINKWLFGIILLGFGIRAFWWYFVKPLPVSDFAVYKSLALGILESGQFGVPNPTAFRPPLYPAFLAFVLLFTKTNLWLSLANVFLSTLLIILIYRIVYSISDNKNLSLLSTIFVAINPTFVFFSPILASEHLYVIFLFSSFWVILENTSSLSSKNSLRILGGGGY